MAEKEKVKELDGKSRLVAVLLGTLISLVVADGIISEFLISKGYAVEKNPFLELWVVDSRFLILKLCSSFLAAFLLWYNYKRHPRASFAVSLSMVIVYTGIVAWNLVVFLISQA